MFYYQTFTEGLNVNNCITDIHLSSIHFGIESDGQPYIHLNNLYPEHESFKSVWTDLSIAYEKKISISLMIGGAGGGWETFLSRYSECYSLLTGLLKRHPIITGIDLDIEESVNLTQIISFIKDIKSEYPHFEISMSPLATSLQTDTSGMGGFIYKDIYKYDIVDYYCGQFYGTFDVNAFDLCIRNGYKANQILMGSINGTGQSSVINELKTKYPNIGGVCAWEYGSMSQQDALNWASIMHNILKNKIKHNVITRTFHKINEYMFK